MHANNTTTDAVEIMHRLFVKGDPEEIALLEEERVKLEIAQHIYDLRTSGGQTQEEFGELVGVSPQIIEDLEEWDYQGDSFAMLAHIEKALWRHVSALSFPINGVYPNVLLGTTITGFKLTLFRYHPDRKGTTCIPAPFANFGVEQKVDRQHILNELAPWKEALRLNRQELQMFALAGMNKWCHLNGGLRVNFSGDPGASIRAVDTHAQLIDAAVHYLHTGQWTALKQWRQNIGAREETRYLAQLEAALQSQTFAHFPDAEWVTRTLIRFAKVEYQGENYG